MSWNISNEEQSKQKDNKDGRHSGADVTEQSFASFDIIKQSYFDNGEIQETLGR